MKEKRMVYISPQEEECDITYYVEVEPPVYGMGNDCLTRYLAENDNGETYFQTEEEAKRIAEKYKKWNYVTIHEIVYIGKYNKKIDTILE